jgi:hypothetical protein
VPYASRRFKFAFGKEARCFVHVAGHALFRLHHHEQLFVLAPRQPSRRAVQNSLIEVDADFPELLHTAPRKEGEQIAKVDGAETDRLGGASGESKLLRRWLKG